MRRKLSCFGHRGAAGHEPENTLRSVRRALELGADGVEVDVRLADGRLVVIHDATLQRTTNGRGRVAGKSFDYLRTLDAGQGERIPTLDEVFETVDRRAVLNIELKGKGAAAPVAAMIDAHVKRGCPEEKILVSAFDHGQLADIKRRRPQTRVGALLDKAPCDLARIAGDLEAWSVNPSLRRVTPAFVERAHQLGLKVIVYTVNEAADLARMEAMGVDGVFSDFPERVTGGCVGGTWTAS
jgi:glycerophosphoryl diester phosphodiesterase